MVRRDSLDKSGIDNSAFISHNDTIRDAETVSVSSSSSGDENCDNELILDDAFNQCNPTFGKISVDNCSDVHFGNKTFYQGPVTIKQFLYTADGKFINSEKANSDIDSAKIPGLTLNNSNLTDQNCQDSVSCQHKSELSEHKKPKHEDNHKGSEWLGDLPRKHVILLISLGIVLVIALVISTAILLSRNQWGVGNGVISFPTDGREQEETDVGKSKDNGSYTLPNKLKIIPRAEWVAQPPTDPIAPLQLPVPYVIIMHTATETCTDESTCIYHVRHIQMYHIESRKWWDIGYNFLVGGDGFAYEGRGWESEGAHNYGYNARSIGIALIGTFSKVMPLDRQITATKQLIQKGVDLGYIAKNYKLLGAQQLKSNESPGKMFFENLKTWDHWAEKP